MLPQPVIHTGCFYRGPCPRIAIRTRRTHINTFSQNTSRSRLSGPYRSGTRPRCVPKLAGGEQVESTASQFGADLPIGRCLKDILQGLQHHHCVILEAPPGAGKTTVVPLVLLHSSPLLQGNNDRILVLEPRRVAAKAAACRMAVMLGESVGTTVGYRVRLDTKVSRHTRIEVMTEGILLRRLQQDPELQGVAVVIFDEFHERNLNSDLCLALCLDAQRVLSLQLRLLVMSATLGGSLVSRLGDVMRGSLEDGAACSGVVPVVRSEGRSFPVKTVYCGPPDNHDGDESVSIAATVARVVKEQQGDVLCFLPGVGEIKKVMGKLNGMRALDGVEVLQLHGNLAPSEQDYAIRRPPGHTQRRVVLSTNIAESSVTLDGVQVVVDSGLCRRMHYDVNTGLNTLGLEMISQMSADQRQGRAGRTGPGVCYRLWEADEKLRTTTPPEIGEADLTPAVLELAIWGNAEGKGLAWVDAPDVERVEAAKQLLQDLGALDDRAVVTEEGRRMAMLGAHPRLAHMVHRAAAIEAPELGCVLAALLEERDPLRGRKAGVDVRLRLQTLIKPSARGGEAVTARRVLQTAQQMLRSLSNGASRNSASPAQSPATDENRMDDEGGAEGGTGDLDTYDVLDDKGTSAPQRATNLERWVGSAMDTDLVGAVVAFAYPDRLAKREQRRNERALFQLPEGVRAIIQDASDPLSQADYLAIANLGSSAGVRASGRHKRVYLAAAISQQGIFKYLQGLVQEKELVFWAPGNKEVMGRRQKCLGRLVLEEKPERVTDEQAIPVLLQAMQSMGVRAFMPDKLRRWCDRVVWLRRVEGDGSSLPDLSEAGLLAAMEQWLAPYLMGVRSKADLQKLQWDAILKQLLPWSEQARMETDAPETVLLPTGTKCTIDYSRDSPAIRARIQEVFGLLETPRLAGGRAALVMELLSPAGHPLQVTNDVAHFWQTSYTDVKKDMKGRYPKHYWPDDPSMAKPTRLTTAKMDRMAKAATAETTSRKPPKKGAASSGGIALQAKRSGKKHR